MVDIRDYIDLAKADADGVRQDIKNKIEEIDDKYDDLRETVEEEAKGVIEDAGIFFKNHKVACFIAAGIEVVIVIGALLI